MKRTLAPAVAVVLAASAAGCRTRYVPEEDRVLWEPTEVPSLQGPLRAPHRHHHHDGDCGCPGSRIVPIPAPDPSARDASPTPEAERRAWVEETSAPRVVRERVVVRERYVPVVERAPERVVVVEREPRCEFVVPVTVGFGWSSWHGRRHHHRGWGWSVGWGLGGDCRW